MPPTREVSRLGRYPPFGSLLFDSSDYPPHGWPTQAFNARGPGAVAGAPWS